MNLSMKLVFLITSLAVKVISQRGCTTQPTVGGTSFEENCIFPFKFGNKTFFSCTKVIMKHDASFKIVQTDQNGTIGSSGHHHYC